MHIREKFSALQGRELAELRIKIPLSGASTKTQAAVALEFYNN
jgi:hypothetical protein